MTRGKVVKVVCHYRDASLLEGLISTLRKLLIDIDWIYGRMVGDDGTYELYLGVKDSSNFLNAVLDLSTAVNVARVEVFNNVDFDSRVSSEDGVVIETFKIYIPKGIKTDCYSWGEVCG
ncbi:MAG: hypothetical protein RMH77_02010 [Sulfolobales archaeon]|nr:hypothetical protein [Sulfolobales archaeon]MDW7969163.1 hypothetical protein [Sulfolobales archaeon]